MNSGAQRDHGTRPHGVVIVMYAMLFKPTECPTPRVSWDKATDLEWPSHQPKFDCDKCGERQAVYVLHRSRDTALSTELCLTLKLLSKRKSIFEMLGGKNARRC